MDSLLSQSVLPKAYLHVSPLFYRHRFFRATKGGAALFRLPVFQSANQKCFIVSATVSLPGINCRLITGAIKDAPVIRRKPGRLFDFQHHRRN
jgi:hypothetical protein